MNTKSKRTVWVINLMMLQTSTKLTDWRSVMARLLARLKLPVGQRLAVRVYIENSSVVCTWRENRSNGLACRRVQESKNVVNFEQEGVYFIYVESKNLWAD